MAAILAKIIGSVGPTRAAAQRNLSPPALPYHLGGGRPVDDGYDLFGAAPGAPFELFHTRLL
jgi:hypothetical protein